MVSKIVVSTSDLTNNQETLYIRLNCFPIPFTTAFTDGCRTMTCIPDE